jgi:hypothetical protein
VSASRKCWSPAHGVHLAISTVAQTSRSAVSRVSKPANCVIRKALPTWKSAIQHPPLSGTAPRAGTSAASFWWYFQDVPGAKGGGNKAKGRNQFTTDVQMDTDWWKGDRDRHGRTAVRLARQIRAETGQSLSATPDIAIRLLPLERDSPRRPPSPSPSPVTFRRLSAAERQWTLASHKVAGRNKQHYTSRRDDGKVQTDGNPS